jgi:hypothetical protein
MVMSSMSIVMAMSMPMTVVAMSPVVRMMCCMMAMFVAFVVFVTPAPVRVPFIVVRMVGIRVIPAVTAISYRYLVMMSPVASIQGPVLLMV